MKIISNKDLPILLILLFGLSGYAQTKKQLTEADYPLWYEMHGGQISATGQWASYIMSHGGIDTVYVKHIHKGKLFSFPSARHAVFAPAGNRIAIQMEREILLLHPDSGSKVQLPGADQVDFIFGGKRIYGFQGATATLWLYDPETQKTTVVANVETHAVAQNKSALAWVTYESGKYILEIIDVHSDLPKRCFASDNNISNVIWNATATTMAFTEEMVQDRDASQLRMHVLDMAKPGNRITLEPSRLDTTKVATSRLFLSDDGKRLFFDRVPMTVAKKEKGVVVWNTYAPSVFKTAWRRTANIPKLTLWDQEADTLIQVETNEYPVALLTPNQTKALVSNPEAYIQQKPFEDEYVDLYLLDLKTGNKEILVSKINNDSQRYILTHDNRYLLYFKDNQWNSCDLQTKVQVCLTHSLPVSFTMENFDRPGLPFSYGAGGSLANGHVLLYDEFDIWEIALDGTFKRKLTAGRGKGISYRVNNDGRRTVYAGGSTEHALKQFSANQDIMLNVLDTYSYKSGYAIWERQKKVVNMVLADKKFLEVTKANAASAYLYYDSAFNSPRRIMAVSLGQKPIEVAQPNKHQKNFLWGHAALIHYTGVNGKELKGSLFYPAGYDPKKKYPMIVYIYEKFNVLHDYSPPTLSQSQGFNVPILTANGYFVLYPDIDYKTNEPGDSAFFCVQQAVNQAARTASIDTSKLGLYGHSFGGFESAYIVGKTKMFKAAVAGAPATDLTKMYLYSDIMGDSRMHKFETWQFRITAAYTSSTFVQQSPILRTDTMETPLLIWTGDSDVMVDWAQSEMLYAGLWRKGKKPTLLCYPGEGHTLHDPDNQIDLGRKLNDWFGYYLKDEPLPTWMK